MMIMAQMSQEVRKLVPVTLDIGSLFSLFFPLWYRPILLSSFLQPCYLVTKPMILFLNTPHLQWTSFSSLVKIVGPAKVAGKSDEVIYPIRQDWEGRPSKDVADQFSFNILLRWKSKTTVMCLWRMTEQSFRTWGSSSPSECLMDLLRCGFGPFAFYGARSRLYTVLSFTDTFFGFYHTSCPLRLKTSDPSQTLWKT